MELKKERAETLSLSFYKIPIAKPLPVAAAFSGYFSKIPSLARISD